MVKSHSAPKVVEDCHQLLIWIIPLLDKFPRNRRFTLNKRGRSKVNCSTQINLTSIGLFYHKAMVYAQRLPFQLSQHFSVKPDSSFSPLW